MFKKRVDLAKPLKQYLNSLYPLSIKLFQFKFIKKHIEGKKAEPMKNIIHKTTMTPLITPSMAD